MSQIRKENAFARDAWSTNAEFWDGRMAEGNGFFRRLLWPAVERLLQPAPGQHLLDVACGNGVTSRRLVRAGAAVTAFDFSAEMIRAAKARGADSIDYRVLDATDRNALAELGRSAFDGALCNMALMDMAEIGPLIGSLPALLRPGAPFVFSVTHPCFNNPSVVQMAEQEDREGALVTTYSVKVPRYLTPFTQAGLAMDGQPVPHPYFHRPLRDLLETAFDAGFALDGLDEQSFPPEDDGDTGPIAWDGRFSETPPALICRLRCAGPR